MPHSFTLKSKADKVPLDAAAGRKLEPTRVTYNTLISACAKGGLYDAALEVYESLKRQGHSPDAYTLSALIIACKAVNYWEEALEFVEEFRDEHGIKLNTVACNALLATLGTAGRWQYAKQVCRYWVPVVAIDAHSLLNATRKRELKSLLGACQEIQIQRGWIHSRSEDPSL